MERVKIKRVGTGIVISHKLEKSEHVNAVELDIIRKNEIPALCPVEVQSSMGGQTLVYRLENYTPLSDFFRSGVGFGSFGGVILELARTILSCDSHGIRSSNLDLRGDYIYIDERSGQLHLLYWPLISLSEYPDVRNALCELGMRYVPQEADRGYAQSYLGLFDKRMRFNIIQFEKSLQALLERWRSERLSRPNAPAPVRAIIDRTNGRHIELRKFPFVVGRLSKASDYACPEDRLMSRSHFTLYERNGEVCVFDNNSTNGTRVNGVALASGGAQTAKALRDGDVIEAGGTSFLCIL